MSVTSAIMPDCFTSDGTTMYAHSTINVGGYTGVETIVLAQSNANPPNLAQVSWKVVSTIPQTSLYYLEGLASIGSFVCYVDSQGVFTILSSTSKSSATDQTPSRARGYQYDPAGAGSWRNVDVSDGYTWTIIGESALFTVTSAGTSVLMQAYSANSIGNTIALAIFDKDQETFVQQNTTWAIPASSGTAYGFAAGNNNLYALSEDFLTSSVYLNIMPVNPTGAQPSNSTIKVLAAPASVNAACNIATGSLKTAVVGNNYYIFCSDASRQLSYLVSSDGNTVSEAIKVNTSIGLAESFLPFGGSAGSTSTWAWMNNSTGILGLTLSGSNVGAWQEVPYKFNITGLPTGTTETGSGSGAGSGSSGGSSGGTGLSHTTLIAIGVGCAVLLIALGSFVYRYRQRSKRMQAVEVAQTPYDPTLPGIYPAGQYYAYPPPLPLQRPEMEQNYELQPTAPSMFGRLGETAASVSTPLLAQPQQYSMPPSSGHPQTDASLQPAWSPNPSEGTTLASNSPQYLNAHSQSPQLHEAMSPAQQRNPQIYRPVAAPQDFGDQQQTRAPANYRQAPQERLEDMGSQYHY